MARVCRSSYACVQLVVVQGLLPQAMPEAPTSVVQHQSTSKPNTTHSRPLAVRAALSCTGTVFAAAHQSYFLGSFSARMRSISSFVDERGSGAHACSPGTAAWVSAVLCATMLLARLCWLRRAADGGRAHRCDRLRAVSGVRKLEARPRRACISACCECECSLMAGATQDKRQDICNWLLWAAGCCAAGAAVVRECCRVWSDTARPCKRSRPVSWLASAEEKAHC